MEYTFKPMTSEYANEIAFGWKYPGIYSFYDLTADPEDLEEFLDPNNWSQKFAVLEKSDELIGFFSYYFVDGIMYIGFGLRPDVTGKGFGSNFVLSGIRFGIKHFDYAKNQIRLAVAQFNQRAIKAYQKVGFYVVAEFNQQTNGGEYRFIRMQLDLNTLG